MNRTSTTIQLNNSRIKLKPPYLGEIYRPRAATLMEIWRGDLRQVDGSLIKRYVEVFPSKSLFTFHKLFALSHRCSAQDQDNTCTLRAKRPRQLPQHRACCGLKKIPSSKLNWVILLFFSLRFFKCIVTLNQTLSLYVFPATLAFIVSKKIYQSMLFFTHDLTRRLSNLQTAIGDVDNVKGHNT